MFAVPEAIFVCVTFVEGLDMFAGEECSEIGEGVLALSMGDCDCGLCSRIRMSSLQATQGIPTKIEAYSIRKIGLVHEV